MLQKFEIFDLNWHPTVNERFQDYCKNIPCNLSTYMDSKFFYPSVSNIVGLPNIGGYSHNDFLKLAMHISLKHKSYISLSIVDQYDKKIEKYISSEKVICMKVHPRFLDLDIFSFDWSFVSDICYRKKIALGICTYVSPFSLNKLQKTKFAKIIDQILYHNLKVILFHSFGDDFKWFHKKYAQEKNILFDTSFSIMRCKTETLDYYCEALRNGFSNLCFGSDFPDYSLDDHLPVIQYMKKRITQNQLENFLSKNALNFVNGVKL